MSKSNIEKYRLQKINQFENNNICIDSSLFKIKIKFKYMINKNNKSVEKRILNIDKKISSQYKQFFSALIYNNLKDLKIYDFNVHLNIEHSITEKNNIIKVKVFIYHKKTLICDIEPLNFSSNLGPRYLSNLLRNKVLNTFEVKDNINIHDFLKTYILECPEIYNAPHFFQNFQVSNSKQCVSFLHAGAKNRIPNILNKSDMSHKVKKLMKFMHLNKKGLGINGFTIRYDFASKEYNSLALKIPNKAKEPVEWFFVHETSIFKNNLEVFQCLKKNRFISFDIADLSEDEVIEMFPILNY